MKKILQLSIALSYLLFPAPSVDVQRSDADQTAKYEEKSDDAYDDLIKRLKQFS
ncbi:hypothetical protein [Pseudoruegeria sp. HB172150]|uniref:hypothetical protein n=1 Tax=Pseudoruegeria sp. HB172150 TaxID=2721164 RepID=UPI0015550944|nr:hypothetical protein [Pseudoruegeria sp. HB172150]